MVGRVTLLMAGCCLWTAATCAMAEPPADSALRYSVGAILPLTGTGASWGDAIRNGMEMAYATLAPEVRAQLRISYEDNKGAPAVSVSALRRLMASERANVIVSTAAQPSLAIAPIAEQNRITFFSIAVPPAISQGRHYSFLFFSTPETITRVLAAECRRRGYRSIARISSLHDGRRAIKEYFDRENAGAIEVGFDDDFPLDITDFRSTLAKISHRKDLDAIHVNLFLGQIGIFARQAREAGITLPMFTTEMFEDNAEVTSSRGALVGQWFVNQANPSPEYAARYHATYPTSEIFPSGNGYEIVKILASAVQRRVSPAQLPEYLRSLQNFDGVLGPLSATADNRFEVPVQVKVVTNNGFEAIPPR